LARAGFRDWIYSRDVADAVARIVTAPAPLPRDLYLLSSGQYWSALAWGEALAVRHPGWRCRLAEPGEKPSVALYAARDRNSLDTTRLAFDLKWHAGFDMDATVEDIEAWRASIAPVE